MEEYEQFLIASFKEQIYNYSQTWAVKETVEIWLHMKSLYDPATVAMSQGCSIRFRERLLTSRAKVTVKEEKLSQPRYHSLSPARSGTGLNAIERGITQVPLYSLTSTQLST
jgi:hypothetical protein